MSEECTGLKLEDALRAHEQELDGLVKVAAKLLSTAKTWRKACTTGHLGNRQKAAEAARSLVPTLAAQVENVALSWRFDESQYLESDAWRTELRETAASEHSMRILEDGELLLSSPITVRSVPLRRALKWGTTNWPELRPKTVAAELKKLREKTSDAASQSFLGNLFSAWEYLSHRSGGMVRFREIYDLFALNAEWKKENPPAAFGQALYALDRAEIRFTKGRAFEFEWPTGNPKERDIFTVMSEDGRQIRYYGIVFR